MKVKLTAKRVKSIKPEAKRREYFDTTSGVVSGFCLSVTPNGVRSYRIYYQWNGQLRCYTIGRIDRWTLDQARAEAKRVSSLADQGKSDAVEERKERRLAARQERMAETFGELAEDYMERWAKKQKRSWPEDQRIINKNLLPRFKNRRAKDIRRAEIKQMLESIADDAPVMANRVLATIRKIYNWAMEQEIVENNPADRIPRPGEEKGRDRVLSEDELKQLWSVFEENPSPAVDTYKLQLLTAQRSGEVHTMRWEDVDLKSRWWTIPAHLSKNGKPHRVWLSDPVLTILKARRRDAAPKAEYVFPGKWKKEYMTHDEAREYGNLTAKANESLPDEDKIKHWTPHDLRRTAASLMTALQIPRFTVSKILNHAESGVTATYDRYSYDREKKEALDQWAKELRVITSPLRVVKSNAQKESDFPS